MKKTYNLLVKKPLKISIFLIILFSSFDLFAHVKWFSGFSFIEKSKSIDEVVNITYLWLMLLSLIVVWLLVILDKKIKKVNWTNKIDIWLGYRQKYSIYVMRVAIFTVLFVGWVNNTIFTPELNLESSILSWVQFFMALLVLIPSTTSLGGLGIIALYFLCIYKFGFFYMLDYLHFIGIGIYLSTFNLNNSKLNKVGIPSLYITLGISLIWLAFEKLYYPTWSLQLIDQNPELALGLPYEFFLQGSAFVEMGLGFLMLLGVLERPLAAVITIVFFITSLVFGKIEIIGHTSLHAMLLVFIFTGTKNIYTPPINRVKTTLKKIFLATIFYILVSTIVLFVYKGVSDYQYNVAKSKAESSNNIGQKHSKKMLDVSNSESIPEVIDMQVIKEPMNMGYNLYVDLKNWTFTPERVGQATKENQGHIHVYLNGEKIARMYSNWYYIGKLSKGKHKIAIILNGDDHTAFTIGNRMIGDEIEIVVK